MKMKWVNCPPVFIAVRYTRFNEVNQIENVDILFLGSSHTYRGFDNRIFKEAGYSSFNLGSGSQTPQQTKILLDRYLENLNPKIVIFEVYPAVFCSDGVESSLDILANDKNDLNSLWMSIKIKHITVFNTFIYASIRDLFNMDKNVCEPVSKKNDTYISGGFVEKDSTYNSAKKYVKPNANKLWDFDDSHFKKFNDIIKRFETKNTPVILVYSPISKLLYNSYLNNAEFDQRMESYNLPYYNFNINSQFSDSLHFYDQHHLNQKGVIKFNQMILDILAKECNK
jgi:hypothetical protein